MRAKLFYLFCLLSINTVAHSYEGEHKPTLSRPGQTGLIELPSARMQKEGHAALGTSYAYPNFLSHMSFQPLEFLEASIRYTKTADLWRIGKDDNNRNLDAKLRFLKESKFLPESVIGYVDGLGTPHIRGPFFAFSKRYYDLDFTLGIVYGNYGLRNLHRDSKAFIRAYGTTIQQKGERLFEKNLRRHSHVIPFGGIDYTTPFKGVNLKVEAVADYSIKHKLRNYKHLIPFNFGASFYPLDWLQLNAGLENGHQWMVGISLLTNFIQPLPGIISQSKPIPIKATQDFKRDSWSQPPEPKEIDILRFLLSKQFKVEAILLTPPKLTVYFENTTHREHPKALGRLSRALTHIAPSSVKLFEIISIAKGLHLEKILIHRSQLEKIEEGKATIEELYRYLYPDASEPTIPQNAFRNRQLYPMFTPYLSPNIKQSLFDQNKPLRIDADISIGAAVEFGYGFLGSAEVGATVLSSLEGLKTQTSHQGHRVRSDIRNYATQGRYHISNLQMDKMTQLGPNWFARSSAGYFEQMFGGASGELLFRPYKENWALGIEINHLWQRTFEQFFDFQKYNVTSGHLSFYHKLPFFELESRLHLGRYLAKDWGGTLELSRRFKTGVVIGIFGTITNIPKKKYDESKFDKGLWVTFPLEWLLGLESRQNFDYMLRPLSKDGGQRATISNRLYGITSDYTKKRLTQGFGSFLN